MNRIKELRELNKISQQELAAYLKVSPSTISNWEANKREPDLSTIVKIADYFNVSIDTLLNRKYNNSPRNDSKDEHNLDCNRVYALLKNVDPSFYPAIEQIISGLIKK